MPLLLLGVDLLRQVIEELVGDLVEAPEVARALEQNRQIRMLRDAEGRSVESPLFLVLELQVAVRGLVRLIGALRL
jgi:hypothetical protein